MEKVIREIMEEAKKDKGILAVALFGSYARGESHRDIDLALILPEKNLQRKCPK